MDLLRDIESVLASGGMSFRRALFAGVPTIGCTRQSTPDHRPETAPQPAPATPDVPSASAPATPDIPSATAPATPEASVATTAVEVILPIAIEAESVEAAQQQQATMSAAIQAIKAATGRAPIILTEDRWMRHREPMAARLLAHLGHFQSIFARNCEIRKIPRTDAATFLEDYHSYGDAKSRYHYGIFHNGTLVAAAEFSNARKWHKSLPTRAHDIDLTARANDIDLAARAHDVDPVVAHPATAATDIEIRSYEWVRYASLPGTRIIGGMGKVLKHFIDEQQPDDIMSYADLEWSEGAVYQALGFEEEGIRCPVAFRISPDWGRTPLATGPAENGSASRNSLPDCGTPLPEEQATSAAETTQVSTPGVRSAALDDSIGTKSWPRYFVNFGSMKYRLKLTDYK